MTHTFYGVVEAPKLIWDNPLAVVTYLTFYDKKKVKVTIEDSEKKERSLNQNNYYWGVVVNTIANELGYLDKEMHELLKAEFLFEMREVKTKKGIKLVKKYKSTTEITTKQYEDYLSKIRIWASTEFGIFIPLPNE